MRTLQKVINSTGLGPGPDTRTRVWMDPGDAVTLSPHFHHLCSPHPALPPPGLLRSPVPSQLSIDSDSDMTESSGLLQEVSILHPQRPRPLIIFIIGERTKPKTEPVGVLNLDTYVEDIQLF